MNRMMKSGIVATSAALVFFGGSATTTVVADGDMIWADEVTEWTDNIQNYGLYGPPEFMTSSTTWWLTGAPDADQDGNGYAWDSGIDTDTVAGWRSFGIESFTIKFAEAIADGTGDDLKLVTYGGSSGICSVWVSATGDANDFVMLGEIGAGTPGYLEDYWFDFDGLVDDVQYVKVLREVDGPQSGRFFDAIGGVPTQLDGDIDGDGDVDQSDLGILLAAYGFCDGDPGWNPDADINGNGCVDQSDLGILLANYGL